MDEHEDLTTGRQREYPEQETAGVQARIERDQAAAARDVEATRVERAVGVESTRAGRAIDLAERRGEERGRLAVLLEGMRAEIAEHTEHFRRNNGSLDAIKETLLRHEVKAETERAATLEYRAERERKENRQQPWKLQLVSAGVAVLLVVLGAVAAHYA